MNGDDSFEKSSDTGLGRRPELKSEDISKLSSPFMRYRGVKNYSQQKKCYTFSELYPTGTGFTPFPFWGSGSLAGKIRSVRSGAPDVGTCVRPVPFYAPGRLRRIKKKVSESLL